MNSLSDMSSPLRRFATVGRLTPSSRAIRVFGTSSSNALTRRLFTAEAAIVLPCDIMARMLPHGNETCQTFSVLHMWQQCFSDCIVCCQVVTFFYMAAGIERSPPDHAAKDAPSTLVEDPGSPCRETENQLQGGAITYGRVRDIRVARRTPARPSESIMPSRVRRSTPQEASREVPERRQETMQAETDLEYGSTDDGERNAVSSALKDPHAKNPADGFDIAANMDADRDVEGETPDDRHRHAVRAGRGHGTARRGGPPPPPGMNGRHRDAPGLIVPHDRPNARRRLRALRHGPIHAHRHDTGCGGIAGLKAGLRARRETAPALIGPIGCRLAESACDGEAYGMAVGPGVAMQAPKDLRDAARAAHRIRRGDGRATTVRHTVSRSDHIGLRSHVGADWHGNQDRR